MMLALFSRGVSPSEIQSMSYDELDCYFEFHKIMLEHERQK